MRRGGSWSVGRESSSESCWGPAVCGAVGGHILDLQERHLGLAGLALLGGRVEDFLDDLGEGAADLEPFRPGLQLSAELLRLASSNGSCWQA